jgi:hypothetical protein
MDTVAIGVSPTMWVFNPIPLCESLASHDYLRLSWSKFNLCPHGLVGRTSRNVFSNGKETGSITSSYHSTRPRLLWCGETVLRSFLRAHHFLRRGVNANLALHLSFSRKQKAQTPSKKISSEIVPLLHLQVCINIAGWFIADACPGGSDTVCSFYRGSVSSLLSSIVDSSFRHHFPSRNVHVS